MGSVRSRWVLVLAVAVLGGVALLLVRSRQGSQAETPAWRTAQVTRSDIVVRVEGASGTIKPAAEVEVKSRATGVVQSVAVSEGERVTRGQVLVTIEDPDAEAAVRTAQANLAQAEANYRRAQADLAAARANLQQTLAGSRPQEIAKAEQAVASARADLDLAQQKLARARQLVAQGFIARQELDTAEAEFRAAQARYRSALDDLSLRRAGSTVHQVAAARAAVRQADAGVASARAQVQQAQSSLRNAQDRLAETHIRAPVSGLVSARAVEVGQTVIGGSGTGGTSVITIAVDVPIYAEVLVDEADITRIRPGIPVELRTDSLPGETFRGRVLAVSPKAQVTNNVVQYKVRTSVADPRRRLRLGMSVDVTFVVERRQDVLVVPRAALTTVQGAPAVRVLVDGRPQLRRVETGAGDDTTVEIRSGLQAGEVVVVGTAQATERGAAPQQPSNPFMPRFQRRGR